MVHCRGRPELGDTALLPKMRQGVETTGTTVLAWFSKFQFAYEFRFLVGVSACRIADLGLRLWLWGVEVGISEGFAWAGVPAKSGQIPKDP